jgi:hypothetical protein
MKAGPFFELESALACNGTPPVYVFKKTAPIFFSQETVDEEKRQADLLEAWWNRTLRDAEHHYLRGFEPFSTPDAFGKRLQRVIEDWLDAQGLVPKGPIWDITKDTPFPGLCAYDIYPDTGGLQQRCHPACQRLDRWHSATVGPQA